MALGDTAGAIDQFRRSLDAERSAPQMGTNCWLDYPWFIVSHQLTQFYDEAMAVLDEFACKAALAFPFIRYRYAAALSLIYSARGQTAQAHEFAKAALQAAAAANHSGLRYHPTVGLVKDVSSEVHERLLALVGV